MSTSQRSWFLDRLLPRGIADPDAVARGRMVGGFGLVSVAVAVVGVLHSARSFGTEDVTWLLVALAGAGFCLSLALLRRSVELATVVLVAAWMSSQLTIATHLGGIRAPNLVFLSLPPLFAALMGHRRLAVTCILVTAVAVSAMYVANVLGVRLGNPPVDADSNATTLVVNLVNISGIAALALLYEVSRARLLATLRAETARREQAETQLRLAQKLESVGQLAAGIAHEVNNPLQYVHDSVQFIGQSLPLMTAMLEAYRNVTRGVADGTASAAEAQEALKCEADADVEFVLENVPGAIERAQDGLDRVAGVVRSMRAFAGHGQEPRRAVDLNDAVLSTLTLAQSEYRDVARLETDLGELPRVTCWASEVNLALLAIVENAAQAVAAAVKKGAAVGRISVRTRREGNEAVVSIADTGHGIAPEIRHRIFDPFFSTKGVGAGIGQGLSLAWAVIVERHGGKLTFESELGRGTTFNVRLPIAA